MLYISITLFTLISYLINKFEKTATLFLFFVLALLGGSLTPMNSYDTASYSAAYGLPPTTQIFESGYMKLSFLSAQHGLLYPEFRMLLFFIAFTIFYIGVVRLSRHPALFAFLYAITIFPANATQVRNFMMLSLVIFGYSFLKKKRIINLLIAIVLVIISAQFQSTGYLYLLGILLFIMPFDKLFKITKNLQVIFFCFFFFLVFVFGSNIINNLIPKLLVISGRGSGYADVLETYANGGISWLTLSEIIAYCVLYFVVSKVIQINFEHDILISTNKILYLLMILGLFGIPMTMVSASFDRLIINSIIPVFLLISNNLNFVKEKPRFLIYTTMSLIILLLMFGNGFFNTSFGYLGFYLPQMLRI